MSSNQNFQIGEGLPPIEPPTIPPPNFRESGKGLGDGLADSNLTDIVTARALLKIEDWIAKQGAFWLSKIGGMALYLVRFYMYMREHMDPTIARFSSLAASDLFGSPVLVDEFNKLGPDPTREQVGRLLGKQVLNAITHTYDTHPGGPIEPSEEAAEQFLATMADLAVEGWFDHAIAGILSEHPTEAFGELKEVFGKVFGFSRLSRRVLGPYIEVLIEKPTQMVLNKKYRPIPLSQGQLIKRWWNGKITRAELDEKLARQGYSDEVIQQLIDEDLPVLTPSQLAHQYHRGLISIDALYEKLNKRGYPDDVIEALLVENRKYIATSDIAFLVRNKYWTVDDAVAAYRQQGYSDTLARQSLEVDRLQRVDAARQEWVSAAREAFLNDEIDSQTFVRTLEDANVEPEVATFIRHAIGLTKETRRKKISEGDAETAVIRGFWTMSEYQSFLNSLHYGHDDILTKVLLITDKIQLDAEAKKKRDAAEKARADLRTAKLAAAKQRQAELEALRLHPALALAQVAAATVRGFLSIDQYRDFLRGQHYAEDDVTILADMVSADRADYLTTVARRQKADAKFATTGLTTAQLERGVEIGALTMDEFRNTLANELVDASDIDVLVKSLQSTIDARDAAAARRGVVSSGLASAGISLTQMERAVRLGLRTLTEYRARLTGLGYSDVDAELLSGLLEDQMQKDQDAEAKRQAAEAAAAVRKIPLADLRAAVKAGLRPIAAYTQALIDLKYSTADVDTMVNLLRSTIDDGADAAARQAALEAAAANMAVPLTVIETAVALGMADLATLADAIAAAGGGPEDVDVITAMVESHAADIATARQLEADATQLLDRAGVSLELKKRGLQDGTITKDTYSALMSKIGFGPQSIALMLDLATTENDYLRYAMGRRAVFDRTGAPREIERAAQELLVRTAQATLADYAAWLDANGYDAFDQATLTWLLSVELA